MLSLWFATPAFLWSLLAIPAAAMLFVFAHFRRKQLTARLGNFPLLRKSLLVRDNMRRWKVVCILGTLALICVASAGPQWGQDPAAQFRKGRDVILVLDLSRSMSAEQPTRRNLALGSLRSLAEEFENHGGNRVALIAFAATPRLFFPLTQDCDHLRHTVDQIEAGDYPGLSIDEPISGTRFGAALQLAAQSFDAERGQPPIVVLLSDGDDPADDNEWLDGANACAERKIRVHTVGFGAPEREATIPVANDLLQFDGKIVRTRLNEPRLRDIARRTNGVYLPAYRESIPLGTFILHQLDADELHAEPTTATLPVYQLRYAWFLLPAVLLVMASMLLPEGTRPSMGTTAPVHKVRARAPAFTLSLAALICISVSDPPAVESLLRQGDEAFARQDYDGALGYYEQAEALTQDPGRVSFNKAAVYYRLERFKEAIECYRRSVEDDAGPAERRARAFYDLGNATLKQAGDDVDQLANAVNAYRAALHVADAKAPWREGARHNLELAQMLWLKASEKAPTPKVAPKKPEPPKTASDDKGEKKKNQTLVPVDPTKGFKPEKSDTAPKGQKGKTLQGGAIPAVVPDRDRVIPLSPDATWATLAAEAERIAAARIQQRNPRGAVQVLTKDW